MYKFLTIILISTFGFLQSQESEPTFFSEIAERVYPKDYYNIKHGIASKITVKDTTFMVNGEKWIEKNVYSFIDSKKLLVKKYRKNELVADEIILLDSHNRIIDYRGNLKYEDDKWYMTLLKYTYKRNKKIKEKINDSGETYMKYSVKYDKLKNPTLIKHEIVSPKHTRFQAINYDYRNDKFVLMDFNYDGKLKKEEKGFINSNYIISKNKYGDITKMYWILTDKNEPHTHEIFYDYDQNGNWIKMIRNVISPNGSKKPYHRTYRTIEYKK